MPDSQTFSVLGLSISAQRWHAGAAIPVIALHGWLDNSESFSVIAQSMPEVDLVALDMAGHGLSDHRALHANYLIWDDLREILAVADTLGWERFALLGHSRGAIVAALLAAACPERVTALGLLDGLWAQTRDELKAPTQLARALGCRLPQQPPEIFASLADMVELRMRSSFPIEHAAAQALVRRNAVESAEGWQWRSDPRLKWPSMLMLTPGQESAFHRAIQCPVELLLAEKGLIMAYPDYAARLELLPAINWSIAAGGHHFHMENAAAGFGEHLSRFFSGVPAV